MFDLEFLREIFKDYRLHVGIGTITQLALADDSSSLRCQVLLLPDEREIVADVCFPDVYDVTFPEAGDLVVVAFVDGHPDEAHVVARLNSDEEPIPAFAANGASVKYARPGKKLYLGSDTKIGIARPNTEPSEPLVLGTVLVNGLTALLDAFLSASQIGQSAMGPVALDPAVRTALNNFKSTYLTTTSTNILSQISFTERGV